MAMTNAERQAAWRKRREKLVAQAKKLLTKTKQSKRRRPR